jgi:hypothetical protein
MTTSCKRAKALVHVHALKSLANVAYDESETSPQDGDQSKHLDESPEYVATFMKAQTGTRTDADMPLSILVALDARARLKVWPRRGISPLTILVDPRHQRRPQIRVWREVKLAGQCWFNASCMGALEHVFDHHESAIAAYEALTIAF